MTGGTFGLDASAPGTNLTTVSTFSLINDLLNNGGAILLTFSPYTLPSMVLYVEGATIEEVRAAGTLKGYKITNLFWHGSYTPASYGIGWNLIVSNDVATLSKNVVDLSSKLDLYVKKEALEGSESDQFASYDNALFGANYFPGNWCLFNQTTAPTDDTNAIRQPDIASGSGVIVWHPRDDSDPNKSWTPETLVASAWPNGRIIHISPWSPYKPNTYLTLTLTSAATLVGTGNQARLWAQASWVEVGNIGDVQDDGDYFRFSEMFQANWPLTYR